MQSSPRASAVVLATSPITAESKLPTCHNEKVFLRSKFQSLLLESTKILRMSTSTPAIRRQGSSRHQGHIAGGPDDQTRQHGGVDLRA